MTTRSPRIYGDIAAACYDSLTGDHLRRLASLLARQRVSPQSVLDIGCGTGALCRRLSARGWTCRGIDLSSAMVRIARQRCPNAAFEVGDARDFRVADPVGLIAATCDVVNHLPTLHAFRCFLRSCRGALPGGGLLAFDALNPLDIDRNWNGYLHYTRREDWRLIRHGRRLRAGVGLLTYEYFVRKGSGCWARCIEEHVLRAWPLERLRAEVAKAGFTACRVLDGDTLGRPGVRTVRWLLIARKAQDRPARIRRASRGSSV